MTSIQQTKTTSMLLVALACSLSAPAHAQCGELTWLEAINQGLEANQALVAARQTLDAQQKDLAIARSTMLPDLFFIGHGSGQQGNHVQLQWGCHSPADGHGRRRDRRDALQPEFHRFARGAETPLCKPAGDVRRYAQPDDRRGRPELRGRAPRGGADGAAVRERDPQPAIARPHRGSGAIGRSPLQQRPSHEEPALRSSAAGRRAEEQPVAEPLCIQSGSQSPRRGELRVGAAERRAKRVCLLEWRRRRSARRRHKGVALEGLSRGARPRPIAFAEEPGCGDPGAAKDDEIGPTLVDSKSRCDFLRSELSQNQRRRGRGRRGTATLSGRVR